MAYGPGRYDDECERLLEATHGTAAVVMVIAGIKGHGISVSVRADAPHSMTEKLPKLLRDLADRIEREQAAGRN